MAGRLEIKQKRSQGTKPLSLMLSLKSLSINNVKDAPHFVKDSVKP
jgi:hypothetical protein